MRLSTPTKNNIDKDSESRLSKQTNPPIVFVLFGVTVLLASYFAIQSNLDSIINNFEVRARELDRDIDNLYSSSDDHDDEKIASKYRQIDDIRLRQSYYHAHKDLIVPVGFITSMLPVIPALMAHFHSRIPHLYALSCFLLGASFFLMIGLMLDFYYVAEKASLDYVSDYP